MDFETRIAAEEEGASVFHYAAADDAAATDSEEPFPEPWTRGGWRGKEGAGPQSSREPDAARPPDASALSISL